MSVVVGFADTDEGAAAAEAGLREGRARGERLVIVPLAQDAARAQALVDVVDRATREGLQVEVSDSAQNDTTDHVLQVADDSDATLIVIGLRRRTNVGKLILGSNAQRILLDAPCPVLTVKP